MAVFQVNGGGGGGPPVAPVTPSVEYLRDRVGVPRDMSYPAAMHFRASLNTAIAHLK